MRKLNVILSFVLFQSFCISQNYLIDTLLTGMNQPVDFALIPNSTKVILTHKTSGASVYDINTHTFISNFWNFSDTLTSCS